MQNEIEKSVIESVKEIESKNKTIKDWALFFANEYKLKIIKIHGITIEDSFIEGEKDIRCNCYKGNKCGKSAGKHPIENNWKSTATNDVTVLNEMIDDKCNIGCLTGEAGGIVVIDIDVDKPNETPHYGIETWNELTKINGIPNTLLFKSGGGGFHFVFKYDNRLYKGNTKINGKGIDIRSNGNQVILPHSLHLTGNHYTLLNPIQPALIPEWLVTWLLQDSRLNGQEMGKATIFTSHTNNSNSDGAGYSFNDLESAMNNLSSSDDYDYWIKIGNALKSASGQYSDNELFQLFDKWSSTGIKYDAIEIRNDWNTRFNSPSSTIGTIFYEAKAKGWKSETKANNMPLPDFDFSEIEEIEESHPWDIVNDNDLNEALKGAELGMLSDEFSKPMFPCIPPAVTFPKAIIYLSSLLCKPNDEWKPYTKNDEPKHGIKLGADFARVKIESAGYIVPNMYSLILAGSGEYKNIGSAIDIAAARHDLIIASDGSAEGILDAIAEKGFGLISINEMQGYLNEKSYKASAITTLVDAYDKGFFYHRLSNSNKNSVRKTDYCYPCLISYCQPKIFKACANEKIFDNGFMRRCLITVAEDDGIYRRPIKYTPNYEMIDEISSKYKSIEGIASYGDDFEELRHEFHDANEWNPISKTLVFRHAQVIALLLKGDTGKLNEDIIKRVKVIIYWLYSQAKKLNCNNVSERQNEKLNDMDKIFNYICQRNNKKLKCDKRIIKTTCRGVRHLKADEIETYIMQMVERKEIVMKDNLLTPIIKERKNKNGLGWKFEPLNKGIENEKEKDLFDR